MTTLPVRFQIAALVLGHLAANNQPIKASEDALRYADALLQLLPHPSAPLVDDSTVVDLDDLRFK